MALPPNYFDAVTADFDQVDSRVFTVIERGADPVDAKRRYANVFVREGEIYRLELLDPTSGSVVLMRALGLAVLPATNFVNFPGTSNPLQLSAANPVQFFRPPPGFHCLQLWLPDGIAGTEHVQVTRVVPPQQAVSGREGKVAIGTFPATGLTALQFAATAFAPDFGAWANPTTFLQVFRSESGEWRTDTDWIRPVSTATGPILNFDLRIPGEPNSALASVPFEIRYVSKTNGNDAETGADPLKPKATITGGAVNLADLVTNVVIVLEAGQTFYLHEGLRGQKHRGHRILVSSQPGVPVYLTAAVQLAPNAQWIAEGNDEYRLSDPAVASGEFHAVDFGRESYGSTSVPRRWTNIPFDPGTSPLPYFLFRKGTADLWFKAPAGYVPDLNRMLIMQRFAFISESGGTVGVAPNSHRSGIFSEAGTNITYRYRMFFRDIEFWGGDNAFLVNSDFGALASAEPTTDLFVNCAFRFDYGSLVSGPKIASNGVLEIKGRTIVRLLSCRATDGLTDAIDGRNRAIVVEDRCFGGYCAFHPTQPKSDHNGSTAHGSYHIRTGGEYAWVGGPVIQDVLDGIPAATMVLGCRIHSFLAGSANRKVGIFAGNAASDVTQIWVEATQWTDRFGEFDRPITTQKFGAGEGGTVWIGNAFNSAWEVLVTVAPLASRYRNLGLGNATLWGLDGR